MPIWGYYGRDWTIEDSTYLAEIATRSREAAQALGARTIDQTNRLRIWLWDVISDVAYNHEEYGPSPLDDEWDPVVKVRAAAAAVRSLIANSGEDAWDFYLHTEEDELARRALDSSTLAEAVTNARAARTQEVTAESEAERERAQVVMHDH